jgi:hypothetical protein
MGDNRGASRASKRWFGMMTRTQLYARTGAAAIAAVLALFSTPTLAQDAGTTATQPVTTTPAVPPPAVDPVATPDPLAPAPDTSVTSTTKTTTTRTTAKRAVRAAKPAPVATRTVTRKVTTHTTAPAATAPVAAAPAAAPAPTAKPAPVVDLSAKPATPPPQQTQSANPLAQLNRNELLLGAGALALIALAAAAIAMRRRRLRIEEEEQAAQYEYEPMTNDPIFDTQPASTAPEPELQLQQGPRHDPIHDQQPAIVAPPMSAFAAANARPRETANGDCEELESWTERAKCGPTPDNPSQSLKKRLKRAAFFEQREREVAAGQAAPVDADAGLPEAMDDERT